MRDSIEILVGVVLIILAGLLIWKISTHRRAKSNEELKKEYSATCKSILRIASAIEKNISEMGGVPPVNSTHELKPYAERYMNLCPTRDAWGNELIYQAIDNLNFVLASPGSDGIFEGFEQEGRYSEYSGQDVIFESIHWKYAPEHTEY